VLYQRNYSEQVNTNKEEQLRTVAKRNPDHIIIHIDDNLKIVNGLKAKNNSSKN
jgi:hypothetical protein